MYTTDDIIEENESDIVSFTKPPVFPRRTFQKPGG